MDDQTNTDLHQQFVDIRARFDGVRTNTEKLRDILGGQGSLGGGVDVTRDRLAESLDAAISALTNFSRRAANIEVRVLLFGPLKSGKSTLMNILARNAIISQIDPRPAYPCLVEVRHEDTDQPKCAFYKHSSKGGETPIKELSLKDARNELDRLLNDFIEDPERHDAIGTVDTRLRIPHFEKTNNTRLVLIDSPGLLFGNSKYAKEVPKQEDDADVKIYIVRVEQLFTANVKEHLDKARDEKSKNLKMRVYLLVNGTMKATAYDTQGKGYDYNQIGNAAEFTKYLVKHVLDETLAGAISQEDIRLGFVDLLDEFNTVFPVDGSAGDPKSAYLIELEQYLRDDLKTKKLKDLRSSAGNCERDLNARCVETRSLLSKHKEELQKKHMEILQKKEKTDKLIKSKKTELADCCEAIDTAKHLQHQARDASGTSGLPPDSDLSRIWQSYRESHSSDKVSQGIDAGELRTCYCQKAYDKWLTDADRTLGNLASLVWETQFQEGCPRLRDLWAGHIYNISKQILDGAQFAGSSVIEQLALEAHRRLKTNVIADWFIYTNPGLDTSCAPIFLPVAHTNKLRRFGNFFLGPLFSVDFTMTDRDFWGEKGRKCIKKNDATVHKDQIIKGMLGASGWDLQALTDPVKCLNLALEGLRSKLLAETSKAADDMIAEKDIRTSRLRVELSELEAESDRFKNEIAAVSGKIDKADSDCERIKGLTMAVDDVGST